MKDLSAIVKVWPVVDGWSVAPEGIYFCKAGARIIVLGEGASIGEGARIGAEQERLEKLALKVVPIGKKKAAR